MQEYFTPLAEAQPRVLDGSELKAIFNNAEKLLEISVTFTKLVIFSLNTDSLLTFLLDNCMHYLQPGMIQIYLSILWLKRYMILVQKSPRSSRN